MPVVTYNGYTLPNFYGKFSVRETPTNFIFACTFLITAGSSSALISAISAAESALKEINKDLRVDFGGTTEYNLKHSDNTGFLASPHLSELDNELSTATSRPFSFNVDITLPFAQYGAARRRSFSVSHAGSRRRVVNFQVEYTASTDPRSGLDNYNDGTSGAKAWAATILAGLGGTFELVTESINEEQERKIVGGNLAYQEILSNDSSGSANHASIVNAESHYSVEVAQEIGVSNTAGYTAIPLITIRLSYAAEISRDAVAADTGIEAVYRTVVKPWIIQHAFSLLGLNSYRQAGSTYIIQSETYTINPNSYRVSGNIVLSAPKTNDSIIHLSEILIYSDNDGVTLQKLWDGKDHTHNGYGVGATRSVQRLVVVTKLSSMPRDPVPFSDGSNGIWVRMSQTRNTDIKLMGAGTVGQSSKLRQTFIYNLTVNQTYHFIIPVVLPSVKIKEAKGG